MEEKRRRSEFKEGMERDRRAEEERGRSMVKF